MNEFTAWYSRMLLALQERITTLVPEIKWIDQDLGQLEFYAGEAGRPPVHWPCLLIDFTSASYDDMSGGAQWCSDTIQLRLGFAPYSYSNDKAPLAVRGRALNYYELEERLYAALHGWDADGLCQPMSRRTGITEKREDAIRVRVMSFTTTFMDESAVPGTLPATRPTLQFD